MKTFYIIANSGKAECLRLASEIAEYLTEHGQNCLIRNGGGNADREEKANLVATALLQGIHVLQARLYKSKLSIDDIVAQAETLLSKYIT